jgi:tetratricopeptide (TPR) repeat protein
MKRSRSMPRTSLAQGYGRGPSIPAAAALSLALAAASAAVAHPHIHGFAHDHPLAAGLAQPQEARERPLVPEMFVLDGAVREAMDVAWLTDAERATLRVFHGQWTREDLAEPRLAAMVAAEQLDADDPALNDPSVPVAMRADVLRRAGRPEAARDLVGDLESPSLAELLVHAEALADMGRHAAALEVLDRMARLAPAAMEEERAADLVALARARMLAATLEGAPSRTWQDIVSLLSRVHQQIDRLHWPALIAEAQLLAEKNRNRAAMEAYHAALALNPRSSEGWYGLGRIALRQFDFGGAGRAATQLMQLRPGHPYAALLLAEMRLIQDDPDGAADLLDDLLATYPGQRQAMALRTAAAALRYDDAELAAAMDAWDEVAPGAPQARLQAGRFLSTFRQYDEARVMLRAAIDQLPSWGEPRLLLGLMEMQTGRDDLAAAVLREAARIDPFNARLANSLALIEELQGYATIETEHFIVRYREGEDAALATMMPEHLEAMHAEIAARFDTEPDVKTIVELMPDHQRFAVRITGMPRLFTIAACTGPVIAMEVPRDGLRSKHMGPFDWIRVMRHEYAHTVTLAATDNRIPHWLTEGAAVSMEGAPRAWSDCLMLANAHAEGSLFTLDAIKWGFVRPRAPQERALAYAQSQWMLEFMTERWGEPAVAELLRQYRAGAREVDAIPAALGVDREMFYERFVAWAGEQVKSWGLDHEPSVRQLVAARGAEILREVPDEAAEGPGSTMDTMPVDGGSEGAGVSGGTGAGTTGGGPGELGPPDGGMGGDAAGGGLVDPANPDGDDRAPEASMPTRPVLDDTLLTALLNEHPNHPDLLRLDLERRLAAGEPVEGVMVTDLRFYAELRPLDPFPHRQLATAMLASDRPADAIPHLAFLDAREQRTGALARRLAELHRAEGQRPEALRAAMRAVSFDPYDAANRELAAAIAIEAGDLAVARGHVAALALLEPDRDLHLRRLEAIDRLIAGG